MKKSVQSETLLLAIRTKCMDCSGNSRREVERCLLDYCPLYPYRSVRALGNASYPLHSDTQISLFDASEDTK